MLREIKKIKNVSKAGVLAIASLSLTSCLNNDDEGIIEPENAGYVLFANISPGSSGLRLHANDEVFNNNALSYNQFYGYAPVEVGSKSLTVRTASSSTNLDTISLNVELNKFYSVFAVNTPENTELLAYLDNPSSPSSQLKTKIRFIQLSHNTPSVKLAIEGVGGDLGTYNFRNASSFIEIDRVNNKKLYLINSETQDTIFSKSVSFNGGSAYSVFSEGIFGSDDENLDLDIQYLQY